MDKNCNNCKNCDLGFCVKKQKYMKDNDIDSCNIWEKKESNDDSNKRIIID